MKLRLMRRHHRPLWLRLAVPAGSTAAALAAGWGFLEAAGVDGRAAYALMARTALGSAYGLSETALAAVPLILAGLAVAIAFRMRLWNIGAEGQLYAGGLAAAGVALFAGRLPGPVMLPLVLAAALAAGAAWAALAGLLRAWLGVSEILSTLMLNYTAILISDHLVYGPWKGPEARGFPMSAPFPDSARLATLGGSRLHAGLPLALAVAGLVWLAVWRTRWGFGVRVAGANPAAAVYAGFRLKRDLVLVMLLSGALAGLAGGVELAGVQHRLQPRFSPGYGYTAILVAWLAGLHPLAVPPVAGALAILLTGGEQLQMSLGVPAALVDVLQGLILLCVLAGEAWSQYRLVWAGPPAAERP